MALPEAWSLLGPPCVPRWRRRDSRRCTHSLAHCHWVPNYDSPWPTEYGPPHTMYTIRRWIVIITLWHKHKRPPYSINTILHTYCGNLSLGCHFLLALFFFPLDYTRQLILRKSRPVRSSPVKPCQAVPHKLRHLGMVHK